MVRNEVLVEYWTVGENCSSFDDILELANVTRPVILEKRLIGFARELEAGPTILLAILFKKVVDEERYVLFTLP
jgi:hypothetical protein